MTNVSLSIELEVQCTPFNTDESLMAGETSHATREAVASHFEEARWHKPIQELVSHRTEGRANHVLCSGFVAQYHQQISCMSHPVDSWDTQQKRQPAHECLFGDQDLVLGQCQHLQHFGTRTA